MTSAISDYAVIGDGRTCALVASTGSIDFLCWPRFDSDACLVALLGDERHGFWQIAPVGYVEEATRRYRGDTMILETVYKTDTGSVRLTDFMPWHEGDSAVVRIVDCLDGCVPMGLVLRLRFGFGQVSPWMQPHKRGVIAEVGPDRVVLDCPVDVTIIDGGVHAAFTVEAGDRLAFCCWRSPRG
jgi:GH15 family glucan-1,4-alpha-glucosidase